MNSSERPRLTIILVTFNGIANVPDLVGAIRALTHAPYDLLIIDNASTDGTLAYLRRLKGEAGFRLVENAENVRCAAATNQAIALSRTEYVVYLCSAHALVTEPGWDGRLVRFMDDHPEVGIAGDVWNPYGSDIPSRRYRPGWTPEAHGHERLLHVQGGAWIARRAIFDELGAFAEDEYPQGGMDVEFSYRLLSHGRPLGRCPAIASPRWPEVPALRDGVAIYHPASDGVRRLARRRVFDLDGHRPAPGGIRPAGRPVAIVFCERIDNESFCVSVIRELSAHYEVRAYGPGWPATSLGDVDLRGARFFLHLDSASGRFDREERLAALGIPKFAWLIDVHKKPLFHREISSGMDVTFYAMKSWGHALEGRTAWLPLHCDTTIFRQADRPRDFDIVFVGSHPWRADAIVRIGKKHGLRVHVACTTGPREKSETAAIYARAKLVFNRHVTNDLNFRVFEAMACGRVLLTDAQGNGQYDLFEDGRHYVLYKDDADLEAQILRLLADDALRGRIEREALALVQRTHSTHARVRDLHGAVEGILGHRDRPSVAVSVPAPPAETAVARRPHDRTVRPVRRWLFFVGDPPATVERRTYAERLAYGLARRGHDVAIARARSRAFPMPQPREGEPTLLELDPGPIPAAPNATQRALAAAGALHARLTEGARRLGSFDAVVGEGPFGALVAEPLAARMEVPFLLPLEGCAVERHGNRLTRDQLYMAELEHWGADRSAAVIVASPKAVAGVERHYGSTRVRVVGPPPPELSAPRGSERLLCALGVRRPVTLVLAHAVGPEDLEEITERATGGGRAVLVAAKNGVFLRRDGEAVVALASQPAIGPALAALLVSADIVCATEPGDARLVEACALGARTREGPEALPDAGGMEVLERLLEPKPSPREGRAVERVVL